MKIIKIDNNKIITQVIILCLCVAIGWFLKARLTPQMPMAGMMGAMEPYVIVEKAIIKDITPTRNYIAHVEPINQVDLVPQVSGYIEKVLFNEGSVVNKGDILFIIEQQKYVADVKLNEANLAKAKANYDELEKQYQRQKSLNIQKYASEATLEAAYSSMTQAKAEVAQAQANLDLAKINLSFTEIKAPFSGKIGKAMITEGNFVSSATGTLATIVQVSPIRVAFSITDKEITDIKQNKEKNKGELYTKIVLPNKTELKQNQISFFTSNVVNPETATISIYSEFDNEDDTLIPGSYVNIHFSTGSQQDAIVVSQSALSEDELGSYVMIVNQDNIVEEKRVTLGNTVDGLQIIKTGISAGDEVIVQGLQKVSNGKKVKKGVVDTISQEGK